jgi:hypothetical protein
VDTDPTTDSKRVSPAPILQHKTVLMLCPRHCGRGSLVEHFVKRGKLKAFNHESACI